MTRMVQRAAFVLLPLLTVVAYGPGLRGEFVFDDKLTVESNSGIRTLDGFLRLAPWSGIVGTQRTVTQLTFALNYAMGGLDPLPYHATNLAIHLVVVLLAYLLVRKVALLSGLPDRPGLACAVAALFSLHPLQTQAVIYVSQRAESLASAFYLGALLLLLAAERRGFSRSGLVLYLSALVAHILGLGTKSIVLTMPLAYLLCGVLPARGHPAGSLASPAKRFLLAVPFLAYSILVVSRAVPDLGNQDQALSVAGFDLPSLPPWHYFLTQWRVVTTYLRLLVWPSGQGIDWDVPIARSPVEPSVLLRGLLLATLLAGCCYLLFRRRADGRSSSAVSRAAAFGVCWFFLVLSQSSSVVPRIDVLMEHRPYLASLGIFLAVVWVVDFALAGLDRTRAKRWAAALLTLVLAILGTLTYARAGVWRTRMRLWADACEQSPRKARAHANLAGAYHSAGMLGPALDEYLRALSLASNEPVWVRTRIHERLAAVYLAQGRVDDAIATGQVGLAEAPAHSALLGTLAMAYQQRGDLWQAALLAEKSVATSPRPAVPMLVLGLVRSRMGETAHAIELFEKALALEPDLPQARLYLAGSYREQGRLQEACEILRPLQGAGLDAAAEQVKRALASCPP